MMKGAGSQNYEQIKRSNEQRDGKGVQQSPLPDPLEGYTDWHSLVGDDDLEDNPNT